MTTPKMIGDLDMVSGLWEYITSVRHGYIQVGISYWAAVVFWCLMGESGGDGCMSRMRSGAKQRLYHIHT